MFAATSAENTPTSRPVKDDSLVKVRYGIIGAGAVSDFHHVPGIDLDPRAKLVMVADPVEALLEKRAKDWAPIKTTTDYKEMLADPEVDAVVVATPNASHYQICLDAIAAGKHILAEKPLGLNAKEAIEMYKAAAEKGIKHMTAFTYRFAPSLRYLTHLAKSGELGELRHFRSQRFQDWPETSWGWRQYKKTAGAGHIYDMTSHRFDFAQDIMGEIESITGSLATFCPRTKNPDGSECAPSEVDDWTAAIGRFKNGATGVWEGSTVMKGYKYGGFGKEWAEVNGSVATAVYQMGDPNNLLFGKHGESLEPIPVPPEFLVIEGSPRDPTEGVPSAVFRYDIIYELTSAIVEDRPAVPSFKEGAITQMVADGVIESSEKKTWVDVDYSAFE